ncbi:shikimate dehydrogenase [Cryobacterium tepidiphilum]|uniref:Shikimate dehydrogenase n=1 Tax=Cryobacterium tepidiphilum TaxID=2486026 RepID=A0A3M8LME0_9MICO|nr:shikimate dehydrogenase [Cryobacterium tepidiphilum]RNE66561.1 shikimate dehydrogenase [Cryobacterium tepidiphilum]
MATELKLPPGRRLAVLGAPVSHSKSPALHRAAYRQLGLDWEYTAQDVAPGELGAFLGTLGPDWLGLSLTMPFKHEALPLLTERDRVAQVTGAANTLLLSEPGADGTRTVAGFNTDVVGIVRALADAGITAVSSVAVLGAGATAASAVMAAAELGAESVELIARTPAKAAPLVELGRSLGLVVVVSDLATVPDASRAVGLVVSTLPGGTRLDVEFPAALRQHATLLDVAYAPWPSALGASWQEAGGTALSGLGMLLHQALIQVRIFVSGDPFAPLPDEPAVLASMRAALAAGPSDAVGG